MAKCKSVRTPIQKRGIEKKNRIIKAARHLFNSYGFDSVTTNSIAKKANVSVGTVYAYYENKQAIFEEVSQAFCEDLLAQSMDLFTEIKDRATNLEDAINRLIKGLRTIHDQEKGLHREILIMSVKDPDLGKKATEHRRGFGDLPLKILDKFKEEIGDVDPNSGFYLIFTTIESITHHMLLVNDAPNEDLIFQQLARMIYRYLRK